MTTEIENAQNLVKKAEEMLSLANQKLEDLKRDQRKETPFPKLMKGIVSDSIFWMTDKDRGICIESTQYEPGSEHSDFMPSLFEDYDGPVKVKQVQKPEYDITYPLLMQITSGYGKGTILWMTSQCKGKVVVGRGFYEGYEGKGVHISYPDSLLPYSPEYLD